MSQTPSRVSKHVIHANDLSLYPSPYHNHDVARAPKQKPETIFNEIFGAESDSIFRFCLIRVSGREQARDLTQETFLRLWATLQNGTEIGNIRPFLFTVAKRLIIDWYRKKKAFSLDSIEETSEGEESVEVPDETTSSESLALGAEGRFVISKIAELDDSYRRAVYLRYVEGLSPGEIGENLGLSANAASVRVNRGLKQLRSLTGYAA